MSGTLDRLPPHDEGAERAVLGSILADAPGCLAVAMEKLGRGPGAFYSLTHQWVWTAAGALFDLGKPVDLVTVADVLTREGQLENAGGLAGLSRILDAALPSAGIEFHCEILKEKQALRTAIRVGTEMVARGYEQREAAAEVVDWAEKEILGLASASAGRAERSVRELAKEAVGRYENYQRGRAQGDGIRTGFAYLDKLWGGGLHAGQMVVLAARPSVGKTSLGLQMAVAAAKGNHPVAFFSLEMTAAELMDRMVFQEARGDYQRYRTGFFEMRDLVAVTSGMPMWKTVPLYVDDTAGLTAWEVRARARRMQAQYGIKAVFVDYLQLLRGEQRFHSREEAVSEMSRGMKGLAKELKVPVVVLAQLNRESAKGNRRPELHDLRESGSIEQDADVVAMLWEPDTDAGKEAELQGKLGEDWSKVTRYIELYVAKQRNGPTGHFELVFRKASTRFEPWERKALEGGGDLEGDNPQMTQMGADGE